MATVNERKGNKVDLSTFKAPARIIIFSCVKM